jgi:16S rRNA (guanine527-N7)-methyltransferase
MTSGEFRRCLVSRAEHAQTPLPDELHGPIEAYFRLLALWNEKINLTALPLQTPSDETFDRLFIEPLAAASHLGTGVQMWLDLGSGGGSPAIPLKIARPAFHLTMIESKSRKAAFLRDVIRVLGLADAIVVNQRFEDLPTTSPLADLVTVRAIRADAELFRVAGRLLRHRGRLVLFRPNPDILGADGFAHVVTVQLAPLTACLGVYERVFHVEQRP